MLINYGANWGIQECTLRWRPKLHLGDISVKIARPAPSNDTPQSTPAVISCNGEPERGDLIAINKRPAQLKVASPAKLKPVHVLRKLLLAPARAQHIPHPAALSK